MCSPTGVQCRRNWEDRETKTVLVPPAMLSQTLYHEVIPCASAAGESLLPDIITSQNF
jgi:hypothetical protein